MEDFYNAIFTLSVNKVVFNKMQLTLSSPSSFKLNKFYTKK